MLENQHQSTESVNYKQSDDTVNYKQFVCMPRFLLDLTKLNISEEKVLRDQVYQLVKKHPDLQNILKLIHPEEEKVNFFEIVNRYNFDHLLELIISSVIEKKISGKYLKHPNLTKAIEIEKQCRLLRPKSFSSGPRLTLLFVYLTLEQIENANKVPLQSPCEVFVDSVLPYLQIINTNIYESDWMLLTLSLLNQELGAENLINEISSQTPLSKIINNLSVSSKNRVLTSLINYGNSIEEEHLLYQDFI